MALAVSLSKPFRMQFLFCTTARNSFTLFEKKRFIHSNVALLKPIAELPKKNKSEDEGSSKKSPILSFLVKRWNYSGTRQFVDFRDEWNPDFNIPLVVHEKEIARMQNVIDKKDEKIEQLVGKNTTLNDNLALAKEIILDVLILVDLRHDSELKQAKYWILTPQATTWRQDMIAIVQQHLGVSTNVTAPLTPLISSQMDETFLKWLYIFLHSLDPFVVSLRSGVSVNDLIIKAQKLTEVLTVVHHATRKIIPKNLKTKLPSNEDIKLILINDYNMGDDAVAVTFDILQRK